MQKTVVIDSDAIFAIYNPNDTLNGKAIKIFQRLISDGYVLVYPASVIFEVISLFQRILPSPKVTAQYRELIKSEKLNIQIIDQDILREAVKLFDPKGSKKNTLVDCSVAVLAKKLNAEAVFSFDNFYVKQKLKLSTELVR